MGTREYASPKENQMGDRAYNALFTPQTLEPRTARNGKPYLRARGTIANRNGAVTRTVLVQGAGYDTVAARLRIGEPLDLRGFYRRVEGGARPGGQFFSAFGLTSSRTGPGGSAESTARTSSEGVVRAVEHEAVVVDIARARDATPAETTSVRPPSVRLPSTRIIQDPAEVDRGSDLQTDAEPVLLEPLRQLAEHERPAPPTIEELEAARIAALPAPTTMLLDGVETEIASDWTPAAPRSIEGHDREGYWRRQHHGPKNSLVKIIWIQATRVKGGAGSSRRRAVAPMTLDLK
jgi:hypothetical protein